MSFTVWDSNQMRVLCYRTIAVDTTKLNNAWIKTYMMSLKD